MMEECRGKSEGVVTCVSWVEGSGLWRSVEGDSEWLWGGPEMGVEGRGGRSFGIGITEWWECLGIELRYG